MRLPDGRDVILTDTVGFIREPPQGALRGLPAPTFEEAADADSSCTWLTRSDPPQTRHSKGNPDAL